MKLLPLHFLVIVLIVDLGPAGAQGTYVEPPHITRVCLWNADNDTWDLLDLDRSQIRGLADLRQEFPAVVDGQWLDVGEEDQPRSAAWRGGPAVATTYAGEAFHTSGSSSPGRSLRTELRKLLSEEQLLAWHRLCNAE